MCDTPNFFDVMLARRSVRKFTSDAVPRTDLEQIVAAGLEAPTGCNAQYKQYMILDDPAVVARLRPFTSALASAPAIIVQLIEPKPTNYGEYYLQDAAASVENMLLAAVALGYASCWVEGVLRSKHDQIRSVLGVPATLNVSALLPVGKPAESPARPPKPTLAQVTHYNGY